MRQASRILVIAAIGTLVLAGCGRREAPPPAPRPAPPIVKLPEVPAVSAADYVKLESSRSLLVVRASELAIQRLANGKVLGIAERLRREHTGIAAQLNMAGRRINLLPAASLLTSDQALFDRLARAPDFEASYLRTVKSLIENCTSAHASYADNGTSPTLRPVARFAASTCRDQLRSL